MDQEEEFKLAQPPIEEYIKAIELYFNCNSNDFEIIQSYQNGPYLVKYNDEVYEIQSDSDLYELADSYLTDKDMATLMPLELWVEVAEGVHFEADFYINLLPHLTDKEQTKLTQILTISQVVSDSIESFWRLLENSSEFEIYPKAIIAATKTYNKEAIKSELVELLVENGSDYLNQLQGGIFEIVNIDEENEDSDKQFFYIYSVDDMSWQVSKEIQEKEKKQKAKSTKPKKIK